MKQTLEHLGLQLLIGSATAAATYLAGADFHALGPYAMAAQGIAATALAALHNVKA